MSVDTSRRHGGGRLRRAAFSLALIAIAGATVVKGVEFARLGAIEWTMEHSPSSATDMASAESAAESAAAGAGTGAAPPETAAERREALARWSDSWGLRDTARQLYFSVGQRQLEPPSPQGVQELAAALQVDPVRSISWTDLAEMTWPTLALRPASFAAWDMSRLTGPYEYGDMLRRTRFLARRWTFADDRRKQQFAYDVSVMARFPDPFRPAWERLLRSLPLAQRRRIGDDTGISLPTYLR